MNTRSIAFSSAAVLFLALAQPLATLRAQVPAHPANLAGNFAADTASNPAALPADRLNESWWAERHASVLQSAAANPNAEVVLIGSTTFSNFDIAKLPDQEYRSVWNQFYAPRRALNLGFNGDTTSNVLWRIDHGEIDNLQPQVVVVLVGGANTAIDNQTAGQTVNGIDAVVGDIARRLPMARVVLLGILPDGVSADITARDQEVNSHLESLFAGDRRVLYLDIGAIFYQRGALNAGLFLHTPRAGMPMYPNTIGQRRLADAIEPAISNLLRDTPRSGPPSAADLAQETVAQR